MPAPIMPRPPAPRPSQGALSHPDNRSRVRGPEGARQGGIQSDQTRAMLEFLRSRGYNIDPSAGLTPRAKRALKDWHSGVGKRSPEAWNSRNRLTAEPRAQRPAPAPRRVGASGGGSGTGGGQTAAPSAGGASGAYVRVGSDLDAKDADRLAGLQFDPQLRDAETLARELPVQGAQNLADIKNWYSQVLASQGKAAIRDAALTEQGIASVGGATSGILGSLGGTANEGAGMIGAAGVDAAASLGALGTSNAQYQEDVRPLLEAESTGVSARELALQRNRAKEVANQIINLRGQRGQAKGAAEMDIRRYNDEMAQRDFQNNLAIAQTVQAAKMGGVDLESQQLRNELMRRDLNQKPTDPGAFIHWDKLPLPDRANMVSSIMGNVLGPQGGLIMSPKKTYESARKRAISMGYNNPQLLAMIRVGINEAWARSKSRGEWRKARPI